MKYLTKKEFKKLVYDMKDPVLISGSYHRDLVGTWFLVRDHKNLKRPAISLPGVKLLNSEYQNGETDQYYKREQKLHIKYENWMYDVFGNYYKKARI